jgi:hypothetical protein
MEGKLMSEQEKVVHFGNHPIKLNLKVNEENNTVDISIKSMKLPLKSEFSLNYNDLHVLKAYVEERIKELDINMEMKKAVSAL